MGKINKFFKSAAGLLILFFATTVTMFSNVKPLTPDVNDTWHVEITTLKAGVRFYGNAGVKAVTGRWIMLKNIVLSGLLSMWHYTVEYFYRLLQIITYKTGAVQYAEALDIQDTSWSGPAASYMITRAVVGADTIEKGCIYVEDGIRKKKTIPRIEITNFIQRRSATPISQGKVAVDGRVLNPADLMLYYEFNPRDYEAHFYAEQLEPKLLGRELPVTAENFMMIQTMKRLNEFFENAIHRARVQYDPQGTDVDPTTKGETADASNYFYFDGLIKKLLDAASDPTYPTISVPTPIALTSTNIRDKFAAALALVPKAVQGKFGKGGLKFCVSYPDYQKYSEALRTDAYKNIRSDEKAYTQFRGYEMEMLAGLPENTFYLAIQKPDIDSNTWLGINSTEDNQLQLMRLQNNSELFFVKGLFKMDTQIGFPDQFVIYSTLTA